MKKSESSWSGSVVVSEQGKRVLVPDEYLCPITLMPMTDPLMSRTGQNYEREAILEWLNQSMVCPLTRLPLRPRDLCSNARLLMEIQAWKAHNHIPDTYRLGSHLDHVVGFVPDHVTKQFSNRVRKSLVFGLSAKRSRINRGRS